MSTVWNNPSSLPPNRLITYLRTLATVKKGLPHGQLVCACASHTITNTDALLQLASAIGPQIAILQIHADIIDDWSEETVRKLTLLAKRYGFLIWEGGQILNARVDAVGKPSREAKKAVIDLIRKKYTRGVIKTASWAGMVTAWASGAGVDNQEADILIPTLKAAARETVADTVQTIRTEITAGFTQNGSVRSSDQDSGDESGGYDDVQHFGSEYAVDNSNAGLPSRKASTISLTHTITQHTEDSAEHLLKHDTQEQRSNLEEGGQLRNESPVDELPPPPLLTRGLVLCLPSINDTSFTTEYRQSCIAAAQANQDFVVGFLSSEPWDIVLQRDDILEIQRADANGKDSVQSADSSDEQDYYLAIFSPLSNRLVQLQSAHERRSFDSDVEDSHGEELSPMTPLRAGPSADLFNPMAARLHSIVGRALRARESVSGNAGVASSSTKKTAGPKIMHIPIITLP